ncbi:MAG TPA: hypothetical protein VEA59_01930 [Patescibacteria group bacterium]|nr:hypothetical protein [Patescibacteria group bacterium]
MISISQMLDIIATEARDGPDIGCIDRLPIEEFLMLQSAFRPEVGSGRTIKCSFAFEEDPETGEIRQVQK